MTPPTARKWPGRLPGRGPGGGGQCVLATGTLAHEAPGELLHIDTKKLDRIERPSDRVTGNRRDPVDGAGWETLFVAADDHARIAFTAMHPDETKAQAVHLLHDAVAHYERLGVCIKRLLTDNGAAMGWSWPFLSQWPTPGAQPRGAVAAVNLAPCRWR